MQALPQWSQQALQQHMGDAREVKTLEQLESGGTGDDIWDAMQHQLKIYGAAPSSEWETCFVANHVGNTTSHGACLCAASIDKVCWHAQTGDFSSMKVKGTEIRLSHYAAALGPGLCSGQYPSYEEISEAASEQHRQRQSSEQCTLKICFGGA